MQRPGSTKNSSISGTGIFAPRCLLLGLENLGVLWRSLALAQAHRTYLVFGDLRNGVLSRDRELIGALSAAPVVGDEDGVRTDRLEHGGFQGATPAPAFHSRPVPVRDAVARRQARMYLEPWLGIVIDERADAARLVAGQELTHDATRGQDDGIVRVDVFSGSDIRGRLEARSPIREVEGARSVGHGVPGPGLEQPHGALGAGGWHPLGRLARTGPEHAEALLDALVRHSRVVAHSALGREPQLLEDRARALEREPASAAEGLGDVLDDAPVLPRLPGAIDGLVDANNAAFRLRHGTVVLFLERPRKHHVGVARALAHEEIDGDVEVELRKGGAHEVVVRQRDDRVEADREQPANLPRVGLAQDL